MQQVEWVNRLMVELPGCGEQSAHNVYYAANRMVYRRFAALWLSLFPGDMARAHRLWVTARERTQRKEAQTARERRAKQRGYYLSRKAEQEEAERKAMAESAAMAMAMRERAKASGNDPDDNDLPFETISRKRRNRRLTRFAG